MSGSSGGRETSAVPSASWRAPEPVGLGAALRRGWIGYQRLLELEMAANGFDRCGFPDGRVLRLCLRSPGVTISEIGRELGITRQGASKTVAVLRERRLVGLHPSSRDGREKLVRLTASGRRYLEAQRRAARTIEDRLTAELGEDVVGVLHRLLEALGADHQPRLREYLSARSGGPYLE